MTKEVFDKKIEALKSDLAKDGIEVHVDDKINPEQLRCEFYKNTDRGGIYFTKGDLTLDIWESGSLSCWIADSEDKAFDSDHAKRGVTFESSMDIHSDDELENADIGYTLNNWFDASCGTSENPDRYETPDVFYSLEEAFNSTWVRNMFQMAS